MARDTLSPPAVFAYHRNVESGTGRRLVRRLGRVVKGGLELPEDVVLRHGQAMSEGDELSDAYINAMFDSARRSEARAMVEQALAAGIASVTNAPAELIELFAQIDEEPDWLDWATVERGAEVFRRYGLDAYTFFGLVTIAGYRAPNAAKPLVLTGAYTGGTAFGRFLETGRFWTDTSEPHALRPGGEGRRSAVMVRIMHSIIRRHLLVHPEWNSDQLGMPISLADSTGVMLLSSFGLGQQLKLIGYRPTDDDIFAMMHLWRYIGHLMGVQPHWWPETIADGFRGMLMIALSMDTDDSVDSVRLAQSFLSAFRPSSGAKGWSRLAQELDYRRKLGYARFYLDAETFQACQLPSAGLWRLLPVGAFFVNFLRETARRRIPGAAARIDRRNRRRRNEWLRAHLEGGEAKFAPVERLSR